MDLAFHQNFGCIYSLDWTTGLTFDLILGVVRKGKLINNS